MIESSHFVLPLPSVAERKITRSKGHFVGQLILRGNDPRVLKYESRLEGNIALILGAEFKGQRIIEQQRFTWVDAEMQHQEHYFDFVIEMMDGQMIAIAVKPSKLAQRISFRERMAEIEAYAVPRHFSSVRVMTERDVCPVKLYNARLHKNADRPDDEADREAVTVVKRMTEPSTLEDLTNQIGLDGRGFFALIRLIAKGDLASPKLERIDYNTVVRKNLVPQ